MCKMRLLLIVSNFCMAFPEMLKYFLRTILLRRIVFISFFKRITVPLNVNIANIFHLGIKTSACKATVPTKLWMIQELHLMLKSTLILRYRKTEH